MPPAPTCRVAEVRSKVPRTLPTAHVPGLEGDVGVHGVGDPGTGGRAGGDGGGHGSPSGGGEWLLHECSTTLLQPAYSQRRLTCHQTTDPGAAVRSSHKQARSVARRARGEEPPERGSRAGLAPPPRDERVERAAGPGSAAAGPVWSQFGGQSTVAPTRSGKPCSRLSAETCASPKLRTPGVSMIQPPPRQPQRDRAGRGVPALADALTTPTARSASGTSALTSVDLPTPECPTSTDTRPPSARADVVRGRSPSAPGG